MVAKLPENPDQTKRLRLNYQQFLNLNQPLLDNFTGDKAIQNIVKTYQVGNPTEEELQAHESHLYTKEALGITKPVVAIRGTVASGKTTIIGKMCEDLNYEFIDNWSLFRAITYYLHSNWYVLGADGNFTKDGHPFSSEEMATFIADMPLEYSCEIDDTWKGTPKVCIDGKDISADIRSEMISNIVPAYGANKSVINLVFQTVAKICNETTKDGIIVWSRDYGTFSLADADYNFYFDALITTRLQREVGRSDNGQDQEVTPDSIGKFTERDRRDITRENGSLRVGENAKIINTGNGTAEEISTMLVRYIKQIERKKVFTEKIAKAETYAELAPIAMGMIDSYVKYQKEMQLPEWMEMVCGPISTGGLGTVNANIAHFNAHIQSLVVAGNPIWDQTIFEDAIMRIKTNNPIPGGWYDMRILEEFYKPLFESGKIKKMYFIPWRESSTGARRERETAKRLGIEIVDLNVLFDFLPTK